MLTCLYFYTFVCVNADCWHQVQSGKPPCFQYIIAGQDPALFTSREAPEDSWKSGHASLLKAVEGKKQVLFVGITCGFSAPFVASQLEYCMDHTDTITSVLLGFNPVARTYQRINHRRQLAWAWTRRRTLIGAVSS